MPALSPDTLTAFTAALIATAKVFAMGAAGFWLVWRGLLLPAGVSALASVVANLALPCLIFQQFALQFDPANFPGWWAIALAGVAFQLVQIAIGWALSRRLSPAQGRDEATMLVGFQNAGFFILPMLQGLVPPAQFGRAVILLFVFIIFFNGSLWPAGNRILLKTSAFDWKRILLAPPTLWTIIALIIFGGFHQNTLALREGAVWRALIGGEAPGAVGLVGATTIPLATIILGATIAQTLAARDFRNRRFAAEIALWKLAVWPLMGLALIHFWPTSLFQDRVLRLLIMLEFATPPATNIAVFCQQHGYPMKLTPAASLVCYALCVFTIPFWVALVL